MQYFYLHKTFIIHTHSINKYKIKQIAHFFVSLYSHSHPSAHTFAYLTAIYTHVHFIPLSFYPIPFQSYIFVTLYFSILIPCRLHI